MIRVLPHLLDYLHNYHYKGASDVITGLTRQNICSQTIVKTSTKLFVLPQIKQFTVFTKSCIPIYNRDYRISKLMSIFFFLNCATKSSAKKKKKKKNLIK